MEPAPPFDCASCQSRIGKQRVHFALKSNAVICARCIDAHDLYDDLSMTGTRAGIAAALGLWPVTTTEAICVCRCRCGHAWGSHAYRARRARECRYCACDQHAGCTEDLCGTQRSGAAEPVRAGTP